MCDKKIEFTKLYLAYAQNKVSTIASFLQNLLQATKKKPLDIWYGQKYLLQ